MRVPDWSGILQLGTDYGISTFLKLGVLGFQVSAQKAKVLVGFANDPSNMELPG